MLICYMVFGDRSPWGHHNKISALALPAKALFLYVCRRDFSSGNYQSLPKFSTAQHKKPLCRTG
jgi:hypothetical protein